jgi:hypothetical protein
MIDYLASFINTDGAAFPDTLAVNVSAPGAGDGTEFVALMVNDIWGRAMALLNYAAMTPDGVTEADGTAQFLDALSHGYGIGPGIGVTYWKNDTPAVHGDRVLLLQGQEILIATYALLFAVVYCGDASNATAPAFYATNGAGVRTTPGAGGTHFVLPDSRGLSLKNIGNATVNARVKTGPVALGEEQEDQGQDHYHQLINGAAVNIGTDTAGAALGNLNGAFNNASKIGASTTDGVHGAVRAGDNFRDSTLGTNYGITY